MENFEHLSLSLFHFFQHLLYYVLKYGKKNYAVMYNKLMYLVLLLHTTKSRNI